MFSHKSGTVGERKRICFGWLCWVTGRQIWCEKYISACWNTGFPDMAWIYKVHELNENAHNWINKLVDVKFPCKEDRNVIFKSISVRSHCKQSVCWFARVFCQSIFNLMYSIVTCLTDQLSSWLKELLTMKGFLLVWASVKGFIVI